MRWFVLLIALAGCAAAPACPPSTCVCQPCASAPKPLSTIQRQRLDRELDEVKRKLQDVPQIPSINNDKAG